MDGGVLFLKFLELSNNIEEKSSVADNVEQITGFKAFRMPVKFLWALDSCTIDSLAPAFWRVLRIRLKLWPLEKPTTACTSYFFFLFSLCVRILHSVRLFLFFLEYTFKLGFFFSKVCELDPYLTNFSDTISFNLLGTSCTSHSVKRNTGINNFSINSSSSFNNKLYKSLGLFLSVYFYQFSLFSRLSLLFSLNASMINLCGQ